MTIPVLLCILIELAKLCWVVDISIVYYADNAPLLCRLQVISGSADVRSKEKPRLGVLPVLGWMILFALLILL